jgi:hypothetical protein
LAVFKIDDLVVRNAERLADERPLLGRQRQDLRINGIEQTFNGVFGAGKYRGGSTEVRGLLRVNGE